MDKDVLAKPTILGNPYIGLSDEKEVGVDSVTNGPNNTIESNETSVEQPTNQSHSLQIKFGIDDLRDHIDNFGINTLWEQSFICPCLDPLTKSPNPTCQICHGEGRAYLPAKSNVKIMIQENDKGLTGYKDGYYDAGSAKGSVQMGYKVSAWDRITVPDVQVRQQYLFNVDDSIIHTGKRIPYDVHSIMKAAYIKDGQLKEAVSGDDYTFDRKTDTLYPKESLLNCNLSLLLNVTLRYIVTNVLKELRYQYQTYKGKDVLVALPRLILLKREEVFINNIPLMASGSSKGNKQNQDIPLDVLSSSNNANTDSLGKADTVGEGFGI